VFGCGVSVQHDSGPQCVPTINNPNFAAGNYIMFASATSGDRSNNHNFSQCSIGNMTLVRLISATVDVHNSIKIYTNPHPFPQILFPSSPIPVQFHFHPIFSTDLLCRQLHNVCTNKVVPIPVSSHLIQQ